MPLSTSSPADHLYRSTVNVGFKWLARDAFHVDHSAPTLGYSLIAGELLCMTLP